MMQLVRALKNDFKEIRRFYDDVIDNTPDLDRHTRWDKQGHPSDDTIKKYIDDGDMYMYKEGDDLISTLALPMYQTDDYHPLDWQVDAADNETSSLHIFAISPKFQRRGYAQKVIDLAIDIARQNSMKTFRLDTLKCNIPAINMYTSLGFRYIGEVKRYIEESGYIDFVYFEMVL